MTTTQAISGLTCLNCRNPVHPGYGYCPACGSTTLGYFGQVDVSAYLEEGMDTYGEQFRSGTYQAVAAADAYSSSTGGYYDHSVQTAATQQNYVIPTYATHAQQAYSAATGYPYTGQTTTQQHTQPLSYEQPVAYQQNVTYAQPVYMPPPAAAASVPPPAAPEPPKASLPSFARIGASHRKPVKPELITERNKVRLLLARERIFLYMHIFIMIAVQAIGSFFAYRCWTEYIADEMTRCMMTMTPLMFINLTGLICLVPIRGTRKEISKLKEKLTYVLFQIEFSHLL